MCPDGAPVCDRHRKRQWLDYDRYVTLLHRYGFRGPLFLHGLSEAQAPKCSAFLWEKLAKAVAKVP